MTDPAPSPADTWASPVQLDDARHQPIGTFAPGAVLSGYHMDLRGVAGSYGPSDHADAWLDLLVARRERVMPVTVLQLGLGAWQRSVDEAEVDPGGWAHVARRVAEWAAVDLDGHGCFLHHKPMPHTYRIDAGWHSAMAQGLGISLFVRHDMGDDASRAAQSLLDPESQLVSHTETGPVLEEYPAEPRPHVLNGWIWALLGLSDLADAPCELPDGLREQAAEAFTAGVRSLVASLPEYETGRGWSTYDRYPHPIANVASPFYHRLHVDMLRALDRVAPPSAAVDALTSTSDRWEAALHRPVTRVAALARKVGFRLVKPRRKAA
jgi:heparosan-N-sulfate-glucuronate 5-epimerase